MVTDCNRCRFKTDPSGTGHCYMFQVKPDPCGVWKKADVEKLGVINAEDSEAATNLSAAELKRQRKAAKRLGVK